MSKEYVDTIRNKIGNEKLNKRSLEKIALSYGITDKTKVKELSELAIVLNARDIISSGGTIKQTYNRIVELYNKQFNLSLRTSHSMMLQQYSTPAPISFLASSYINKGNSGIYFEPSAGNGLLTIALPYSQTYVNEIDKLRNANLKQQAYAKVTSKDATKPFLGYNKKFDGIITNPPFGTVDEPIMWGGYKIKHLDHVMTIIALDTMKNDGKAAIIIGSHSTWDSKGRLTRGKNRIFLNYLYRHYHVEDVISIYGKKLYTKQGTGFNTRLILINGRKKEPNGFAPLKNDQLAKVVDSFEELWDRVGLTDLDNKAKLKLRAKALRILQKQAL